MNIYSIPFFYIIQHKTSKKLYVGSKYSKKSNPGDLLKKNGYLTSSNKIKNILQNEGLDSFEIIRIDTFCDGIHPLDYETLFLETVDARNNSDYLNDHNNEFIHENWTDIEWRKNIARKGGKVQGSRNSNNGHMKRIQKLGAVLGGKAGGRQTILLGKGAFGDPIQRLKISSMGGKVQGPKNKESGHLKRIANNYWSKVKSGEIERIKRFWICNLQTKKNKMLSEIEPIPEGWSRGKIQKKNFNVSASE